MSKHLSADDMLGINPADKLKLNRPSIKLPKITGSPKRANYNNQDK